MEIKVIKTPKPLSRLAITLSRDELVHLLNAIHAYDDSHIGWTMYEQLYRALNITAQELM